MADYGFTVENLDIHIRAERKPVEEFLRRLSLSYDRDVTHTLVVKDGERIIATGSLAGNIAKCIGVDPSYQGTALTNTLVSQLEMEAYRLGIEQLYLFSRPKNREIFEDLGFFVVGEYPGEVVLLEKPGGGIDEWLASHTGDVAEGSRSTSLVMNCNPFTLGHRYLVEQASARAAEENELVHLFVVSEDRSLFPEAVRRRLVQAGTSDLENVRVHPGGPYIISSATFPTYFIRDADEATRVHAGLDVHIFGSRIAPAFGLSRRMVGEEPYCPVTEAYNQAMRSILPDYGVELEVIPRLQKKGQAVSASVVRELIRENRLRDVRELVPESTWEYLNSPEAEPVIEKIMQEKNRRH